MSKTGSIIIETSFVNKENYLQIFNVLTNNGWSANRDNVISFMVNGTYTWRTESYVNLNNVLEFISASIDNRLETNIDLGWENTEIGLGLMYSKPNELIFLIAENILRLEHSGIADFSWYLGHIAPVFEILQFNRIECNYS